ncbi:hypothetical protein [Clostridium sp. AWRP]|uniref:hypothetical protein n=1 Tax=Clostridium sp. AWRP TaxID=2212991 RepID=UPI000FD982ED|nr:hypothetical protein [Clostridium sp. AWRP]AZV57929.1 hypothetical protein DMR38_15680 [Clostridium sp. AWRP]
MAEADILSLTYFDRATVKGEVKYKKENGALAFKLETKVENMKCAVSRKDAANVNQTNTINNIQYNSIMFCAPDSPIVSGDYVQVMLENGVMREYEAGEPFYYKSHLEVPLFRKEKS